MTAYKDAITCVAAHVLCNAAANARYDDWEEYPELCERQWRDVCAVVRAVIEGIRSDYPNFSEAYAFLEARASAEEDVS